MPRSPRSAIEVEMLDDSAPKKRPRARTRKGLGERDDHPSRRARPAPPEALRGTKKWTEPVDVCGQRYAVKVDPVYGNRKNEGSCTWADNLIEVLEQAPDRMHDALVHEIIHAINDASGLKWAIANRFKKLTLKERRDLDELLCRFLAPAILATFRNAGWLKLPAWPPKRSR